MKNLTCLFTTKSKPQKSKWGYALCSHTSTISFRHHDDNDHIFKTVNSVYLDISDDNGTEHVPSPFFFTNSNSCESTSPSPEYSDDDDEEEEEEEAVENVISQVAKSERFFFEPNQTNSLVQEIVENNDDVPFKESVMLQMESENPYADFKTSMEEIVERHRLKDQWEHLEELLEWYLKVNGRRNHKYIIGAFVDLLVAISSKVEPCETAMSTYSSAVSCISSPSSVSCSFETAPVVLKVLDKYI